MGWYDPSEYRQKGLWDVFVFSMDSALVWKSLWLDEIYITLLDRELEDRFFYFNWQQQHWKEAWQQEDSYTLLHIVTDKVVDKVPDSARSWGDKICKN